jgi:hypothetical protein
MKEHQQKMTHTYRVFQKELYNGIPNVTVCQVLQKHLHLKVYKVSVVQHLEEKL